jgi:uncharacterized coiled-coil DUF342 family protein
MGSLHDECVKTLGWEGMISFNPEQASCASAGTHPTSQSVGDKPSFDAAAGLPPVGTKPSRTKKRKQKMPVFLLITAAFLIFGATIELFALEHQPATLVALFLSLPVPQQIGWVIICLVPLVLLAVCGLQHARLVEKRKVAESLETRLHSIRTEMGALDQSQKASDQAAHYLDRSDPEGTINALETRMTKTGQAIQFHQERNLSGELTAGMEQLRQKQHDFRQKLGDVIAKRRSIETSLAQLQSSQDEMEKTISVIEQDAAGETPERRLQNLFQFVNTATFRSEEIERSLQGLLELEERFNTLERRLVPLQEKGGVLTEISELRDRLDMTIAGLERNQGVNLADRVQQLRKTKDELQERVSTVLAQIWEIEGIHQDMTTLVSTLNQRPRLPRESEGAVRVVATNGNGNVADHGDGEATAYRR